MAIFELKQNKVSRKKLPCLLKITTYHDCSMRLFKVKMLQIVDV